MSGNGTNLRTDSRADPGTTPGAGPDDRGALKERLKEILITGLRLHDLTPASIADDQAIFVDGLGLDSIDALELAVLIEEHFGIAIPDEEVGRDVFASINALAEFVCAEQARSA